MNFPVLASLVVFILIMSYFIKRSDKKMEHALDDFFEKEKKANHTRKKSLENLPYITIPDSVLSITPDEEDGMDALLMLQSLSHEKIVNFTGITNTDLKLTYGTANITVLTQYDQNFTLLVRSLQKLAEALKKAQRYSDEKTVLEFAISIKTDISASYRDLAELYVKEGSPEKIQELIIAAKELNTAMAPAIVRSLEEKLDFAGHCE